MTQYLRAIFCSRGRRFPSAGYASVEQFVGGRLVIPDGDRRQSTESRGIVDKPDAAGMSDDDIVGVFVLNDDIAHHL